jgi:hypothetical protein
MARRPARSRRRLLLFVNIPDAVPASYQKYLTGQLREQLGLEHAPIRLFFRPRRGSSSAAQKAAPITARRALAIGALSASFSIPILSSWITAPRCFRAQFQSKKRNFNWLESSAKTIASSPIRGELLGHRSAPTGLKG